MENKSLADYYLADKKIEEKNKSIGAQSEDKRLIRIALLGSFTLKGIKEVLNVKCDEKGLVLKTYLGGYGQYNQEILDKDSNFYQFKPHLSILFLDIKDMLGEDYYFPYRLSGSRRRLVIKEKLRQLTNLVEVFKRNSSGKLILHNFSVPFYSPVGILENKQDFGLFEMVRHSNRLLDDTFRKDNQIFVFDYDAFLSKQGKLYAYDDKMYYLADMKLNPALLPDLCREYMRYIMAIKGKTKKCLVLDLDDTLWGGIVGEDGFEGVKLGPTPPGNAFLEFQKHLLSLFERGIILAINSSNNKDEALKVLNEHPYMLLREDKFATIKINWENKINNMMEISKELNLGLDSIIYIDDNIRNRQMMREILPEVFALELPEDPALYIKALRECIDLDTLRITVEDKRRGKMYTQERKRKESRLLFKNISDFLKHLDIRIRIEKASKFSLPRISQLTQRTNQFNFTARRYQEEDMRLLLRDSSCQIYSITVTDRFGDSGISGAVILKKGSDGLIIDNFLLSCRVLGKEIEKSIMNFCFNKAKRAKAKYLTCEYIPNPKNPIVREFLEDNKFSFFKKEKNIELWRFEVKGNFPSPKFIKIISK